MPDYGVTRRGFRRPLLGEMDDEIRESYAAAMRSLLGKGSGWSPIWTDAQTSTAFYRVLERELARLWEAMEATYFSASPLTASGDALDLLIGEHGMVRRAAYKARHIVTFDAGRGAVGVVIPKGTKVGTTAGVEFVTLRDESSRLDGKVDAIVEAVEAGPGGNVGGGAISVVFSSLPASVKVSSDYHLARLGVDVTSNTSWEVPVGDDPNYFQVVKLQDIAHPRFLERVEIHVRNPAVATRRYFLRLQIMDHTTGKMLYHAPEIERVIPGETETVVAFEGLELDLVEEGAGEAIRLALVVSGDSDGSLEVLGNTTLPYVRGRWWQGGTEEPVGSAIFSVVSLRPGVPIQFGGDPETDAELRLRYLLEKARGGSSHPEAVVARIWNVPNVEAVSFRQNRRDEAHDGLPPHSLELTVDGGNTRVLAETLFRAAPCGIELVGNTTVGVVDIHGGAHDVKLNRPQRIPVYVTVKLKTSPYFRVSDFIAAKDAIIRVIGGQDSEGQIHRGAGVGGTVRVAKLIDALMDVRGVLDIESLKLDTVSPPEETGNLSFGPSERPITDETRLIVTASGVPSGEVTS